MVNPSPLVRQAGNLRGLLRIHEVCRRNILSSCSHVKDRCRCRGNACKQIWVLTTGTFFYSLQAPVSLILAVLKLLSEGVGLRAVCRSKRVTPEAVSAWVQKAAKHVREVTVYLERDMHLTQWQIDEFGSYILKKSAPERRRIGSRGLGG